LLENLEVGRKLYNGVGKFRPLKMGNSTPLLTLFIWLLLLMVISLFRGSVAIGLAGSGKIGIGSTSNAITNISSIIFQVIAIFLGYGAPGLAGGLVAGLLVRGIIEFHFFVTVTLHVGVIKAIR
jgi:hypothetical protein